MLDDEIEYRYTAIFPMAKCYSVDDVLNFISEADYQHTHFNLPERNTPFLSTRSILNNEKNPLPGEILERKGIDEPRSTSQKEIYVESQKSNLIGRFLKDVLKGKYELWNWTGDRIVDPPAETLQGDPLLLGVSNQYIQPAYQTVFWWAKMAYIYKSDLTKFCRDLRIYASFEGEQFTHQENITGQVNKEFPSALSPKGMHIGLADEVDINSKKTIGRVFSAEDVTDVPMGNQRWRITKLAITAAWELEKLLGRKASPAETIEKLQEWATSGNVDGCLIDVVDDGVRWLPKNKSKKKGDGKKDESKIFDVESCAKALDKWHQWRKSQAKSIV